MKLYLINKTLDLDQANKEKAHSRPGSLLYNCVDHGGKHYVKN